MPYCAGYCHQLRRHPVHSMADSRECLPRQVGVPIQPPSTNAPTPAQKQATGPPTAPSRGPRSGTGPIPEPPRLRQSPPQIHGRAASTAQPCHRPKQTGHQRQRPQSRYTEHDWLWDSSLARDALTPEVRRCSQCHLLLGRNTASGGARRLCRCPRCRSTADCGYPLTLVTRGQMEQQPLLIPSRSPLWQHSQETAWSERLRCQGHRPQGILPLRCRPDAATRRHFPPTTALTSTLGQRKPQPTRQETPSQKTAAGKTSRHLQSGAVVLRG